MDGSSKWPCECPPFEPGNKNLVVCIDGTSNQFGKKNTNVIELYSHLTKDSSQYTYYNSGIGASANVTDSLWDQIIRKVYGAFDLAFAWSFHKNIRRAYRWLLSCYNKGDRIFLFGFSRGAYQVRVLAGMLETVGLLYRGNEDQIPFAYSYYKDQDRMGNDLVNRFKNAFSQTVRVHFVGVWDTVSSVGFTRGKLFPRTREVDHICFFRHALALDERRVKFHPEYVRGGVGPPLEIPTTKEATTTRRRRNSVVTPETPQKKVPPQQPTRVTAKLRVKEVWFPGTHSDIGGGRELNPELNAGTPPLRWMVYEAALNGLDVTIDPDWRWNPFEKSLSFKQPTPNPKHFNPKPLSIRWKWINYMPVKRLTYKGEEELTCRPLMWRDGRTILRRQKIHYSIAFGEYTNSTHPHATPPPNTTWKDFVGVAAGHHDLSWTAKHADLWEIDVFDDKMGREIVGALKAGTENTDNDVALYRLKLMTGSAEGCRALVNHKEPMWDLLIKSNSPISVRIGVADAFEEMVCRGAFYPDWDIAILVNIFKSDHEEIFLRNAVGRLLGLHHSGLLPHHDYTNTIKTLLGGPPEIKPNTLGMLHRFAKKFPFAKLFDKDIASIFKEFLSSSSSDLVETVLLVLEQLAEIKGARAFIDEEISKFLVKKLFDWPTTITKQSTSILRYYKAPKKFSMNNHNEASADMTEQNSKTPLENSYWGSYSFCISAMNIISQLLQDDKLRHDIVEYAKGCWSTRKCSAAANLLMVNLTTHGALTEDQWLSTDIVDFLQKVLRYGEEDAKRVCLRIFSLFVRIPRVQSGPRDNSLVLPAAEQGAENGNPRDEMLSNTTISIIRQLLVIGTDDTKKAVLDCIFDLSSNEDDFRNKVFDSAMISEFRNILRRNSKDVKYAAINAFYMKTNNDDFREKVFIPEITTVLQEMLCSNEADSRRLAESLLSELAENDELRDRVFTSETLDVLDNLVRNDNVETMAMALGLFFTIGRYSDDVHKITIGACRDALRNGSKDDKNAVIQTFYGQTDNGDVRNKIFILEITKALQDMLRSTETDAMHLADALLTDLAGSDELRDRAFTTETITLLESLVQNYHGQPQSVALGLLFTFGKYSGDIHKPTTDVFHDILRNGSEDAKHAAIRVFNRKTINGDFRNKIFIPEITTILLDMLRSNETATRKLADSLLSSLACSNELRDRVFTSQTISVLADLLEKDTVQARIQALGLFFTLDLVPHFGGIHLVDAFRNILHNGSQDDKCAVIRSFHDRTKNGNFRNKIFIPEINTVLQDMVLSNKGDHIQVAFYLLSELVQSDELRGQVFTSEMISVLLQVDRQQPNHKLAHHISQILNHEELHELVDTIKGQIV